MRARFVEAEVKRQGKGEEIEILPDSGDVCLSLSYYRISAERERERERREEWVRLRTINDHHKVKFCWQPWFPSGEEAAGKEEPLRSGFFPPLDGWIDSNFQHSSQLRVGNFKTNLSQK